MMKTSNKGFTLIELVAVTAIIVIVSSIVLVNNARFGGVIQLQTLVYDVALTVRQAQVYGISVARSGTGLGTFSAGYGVHFDISSITRSKSYMLFADAITANSLYDCPSSGSCELVATTNITRGYRIQSLCVTSGGLDCTDVSELDIVFVRPEPDALISVPPGSCLNKSGVCYESAQVTLASPRGDTMSIVVWNNGQISVKRQ